MTRWISLQYDASTLSINTWRRRLLTTPLLCFRAITKQWRKNLNKDKSDSVVYLRKVTPEGVEKMYTFTITNNEVTSQVHKAVKFSDLPASVNCAVRSNKFHQPCEDTNLLLLILVVFACPVIMMLLTFFFTLPKHNEPYNHL